LSILCIGSKIRMVFAVGSIIGVAGGSVSGSRRVVRLWSIA